jgi:hypothetical protein
VHTKCGLCELECGSHESIFLCYFFAGYCVILAFELKRDNIGVKGLSHGQVNETCFFGDKTYLCIQI